MAVGDGIAAAGAATRTGWEVGALAGTGSSRSRQLVKLVFLGLTSVVLYAGLYAFDEPILESSARGGWYFLIPVIIAFVFSIAHGTFTGHFWEVLGVRAKR